MKKRMITLVAVLVLVLGFGSISAYAKTNEEPVVEGEAIEFKDDEQSLFETLVQNAKKLGMIDLDTVKFAPKKSITYGEFMAWVMSTVGEKHYKISKKGQKDAIKVYEWMYPEASKHKYTKKLTYKMAKEVVVNVVYGDKLDSRLNAHFKNLKKEIKLCFPTLSRKGEKMSRIEALYYIYVNCLPEETPVDELIVEDLSKFF